MSYAAFLAVNQLVAIMQRAEEQANAHKNRRLPAAPTGPCIVATPGAPPLSSAFVAQNVAPRQKP